jgi:glycosyltransferase involved in cell wall biosynthesis
VNILVIDQFSDPGGAQLCLRDLLPGFLERGWKPRLMVPGAGRLIQTAAEYGVPVHRLPLGRYANGRKSIGDVLRFGIDMARAAAAVRSIARRHTIDLVYVNGPRPLPAAAGTGLATVFHSHSVLDRPYARRLAAWALRHAGARVIAASRHVAESLSGLAERERVQVVYAGVGDLRQAALHRADPVRIGIVGRIAPEKGHADFLETAKLIRSAGRNVRFVVRGAALFSGSEYERRVRSLGSGLPVDFRGWVEDVGSALRELDIVAVPSRTNEAAPRVVMEALSAGTPVVAYRSGGIPELIEDGISGVLTASPTPESLAHAILSLIDNPERRTQLAEGGRRRWERCFTLERYRREVCGVVEDAVRARSTIGRGCR